MSLRLRLRKTNSTLIGLAIVSLLLLLAYRETLVLLTTYWASNDMYSYGFLVPLISGLMFWSRRHELATTHVAPSIVAGGLVTLAGLTALQFGRSSATNLIQETSLVVTVVGLTLLLMGWAFLRRFWFPVVYLLAMIPFWDFLTRGVQPFFQLYSAVVGVWLIKLLGIPVLREGFFIDLPNVRLEVAEACSGINHLVAVLCIGVPATLLLIRSWRRRVFILSSAVVIALVSNGVRVAVVCLFAYHGMRGAGGDIHGPYALFRSLVISGVGFLVLFGLISYYADKETPWRPTHLDLSKHDEASSLAFGVAPSAILLAVLLLCSSLGVQHWHRSVSVPPSLSLAGFPAGIAGWQSTGPASFGLAFDAIQFDDKLSRNYVDQAGRALNVRIGYFRDQAPGKKLAGWDMARIFANRTGPDGTGDYRELRAKDLIEADSGGRLHVTYWYVVGRTPLDKGYQVRLLTGVRSLFFGRSNGALIIVTRRLADSENVESSREIVRAFIDALMPIVKLYLPQV